MNFTILRKKKNQNSEESLPSLNTMIFRKDLTPSGLRGELLNNSRFTSGNIFVFCLPLGVWGNYYENGWEMDERFQMTKSAFGVSDKNGRDA